jgi:hypothetical protein
VKNILSKKRAPLRNITETGGGVKKPSNISPIKTICQQRGIPLKFEFSTNYRSI